MDFKKFIEEKLADTLSPNLWDKMSLKPEVKIKLDEIADVFIEHLKLPVGSISDIILTGSSANYNYHDKSDIDLHIEIDAKKLGDVCAIDPLEYLVSKKTTFNEEHNIVINGFPVEVYAELSGVVHTSNAGVYSILKDVWVSKPTHFEPEVNNKTITDLANKFKNRIDAIIKNEVKDLKIIEKVRQDIKDMRKNSLMGDKGEYGEGNLAFKELRNSGYMEKIVDYARLVLDTKLSL